MFNVNSTAFKLNDDAAQLLFSSFTPSSSVCVGGDANKCVKFLFFFFLPHDHVTSEIRVKAVVVGGRFD